MRYRLVPAVVLLGLLAGALCAAGEPGAEPDLEREMETRKPTISLGAGVVVSSKPYVGANAGVYPIPMFAYEGRRLYLRGVALGYRFVSGRDWSVAPVLWPRFDGYEEEDSSSLRGMDDRDVTLDAGAAFTFRGDWGVFGAALVTDILGKHDGQELELSYSKPMRWDVWTIAPAAGLRWQSSNLTDYYYGVRDGEARLPDRPPYYADGSVNPFVALRVQRPVGRKWSLLGVIQYEWFDDEISDSPIVDESYDITVLAGVLYTF